MTVKDILDALYDFYNDSTQRSLEYTFGFFDAVGVIRDLTERGPDR